MNAKDELIRAIGEAKVLAAKVEIHCYQSEGAFLLAKNHSVDDWEKFLNELNFDYDNGYGSQNLYGTVWLTSGTWLERGEYDGSEWWELRALPALPEELQ